MDYNFYKKAKIQAYLLLPIMACTMSLHADNDSSCISASTCPYTSNKEKKAQPAPEISQNEMQNSNSNSQAEMQRKRMQDGSCTQPQQVAMNENDSSQMDMQKKRMRDGSCTQPQQVALGEDDPNNPMQPPQTIAAADMQDNTKTQDGTVTQSCTLSENKENGKILVFDNNMSCEVPVVLRKKTMNWTTGDKIVLEKGRRDSWYKITNTTRDEKVRAKMNEMKKK